jgi:hypothetical protein
MICLSREEDPGQPNDARGSIAWIDIVSHLADRARAGVREHMTDLIDDGKAFGHRFGQSLSLVMNR